tara:strand:+ start:18232 stop:18822 length:591 start_codon:yes stop_codon:yes gene_type:complete
MGIGSMSISKFYILCLIFLSQNLFGMNIGVEGDIFHPLLRSSEKTQFDRSWISARLFFAEDFHLGGEFIYDDGEVSGSASGSFIGEQSAPTYYRGASAGYYPSGYLNNSVKLVFGAGSAQRKFIDTFLGETKSNGYFYFGEVGYQFVGRSGLIGISLASTHSDLQEEASFTSGINESSMSKRNSDLILKVTLGILF